MPVGATHDAGGIHVEGSTDSVDGDGNVDAAESNDGDDVFGSLGAAVKAAEPGDTVEVAPGTYTEKVTVTKSITVTGDRGDSSPGPGPNAPVFDGEDRYSNAFDIAEGVSDVTIEGLEIRNYTRAAVAAGNNGTDGVLIRDVHAHDLGWTAIAASNRGQGRHSDWTVTNNVVEEFDTFGVRLANTRDSRVTENVIRGSVVDPETGEKASDAVLVEAKSNSTHAPATLTVDSVTVRDNTVEGPFDWRGIEVIAWNVTGSDAVSVTNATVTNNTVDGETQQGIAVSTRGPHATVDGVTIAGNEVSESNFDGIFAGSYGGNGTVEDVTITENEVTRNAVGVGVVGQEGITIGETTISHNEARNNSESGVRLDADRLNGHLSVLNNTAVQNRVGVAVSNNTTPTNVSVHVNNLSENEAYGVQNNATGVVNATENWWGADSGPSSPGNGTALADPVTGELADGSGSNVSASVSAENVSNVHFAPWQSTSTRLFSDPLPGTGSEAPPADPDGDGRYEDVDGDGVAAFDDAISLAFADTSGLSERQLDGLDFDGDGDVDFDDAIDLAFTV
ncbi:MAG: right-handed parallel beta-helix repeat-containing protein [Halobacteriota archaeon]